jgi:hypothetical protein
MADPKHRIWFDEAGNLSASGSPPLSAMLKFLETSLSLFLRRLKAGERGDDGAYLLRTANSGEFKGAEVLWDRVGMVAATCIAYTLPPLTAEQQAEKERTGIVGFEVVPSRGSLPLLDVLRQIMFSIVRQADGAWPTRVERATAKQLEGMVGELRIHRQIAEKSGARYPTSLEGRPGHPTAEAQARAAFRARGAEVYPGVLLVLGAKDRLLHPVKDSSHTPECEQIVGVAAWGTSSEPGGGVGVKSRDAGGSVRVLHGDMRRPKSGVGVIDAWIARAEALRGVYLGGPTPIHDPADAGAAVEEIAQVVRTSAKDLVDICPPKTASLRRLLAEVACVQPLSAALLKKTATALFAAAPAWKAHSDSAGHGDDDRVPSESRGSKGHETPGRARSKKVTLLSMTQPEVESAAAEYKAERAKQYSDIKSAIANGSPEAKRKAKQAATQVFGRNAIARAIGCKSKSMVSKTKTWKSISADLGIGRQPKPSPWRHGSGGGAARAQDGSIQAELAELTHRLRSMGESGPALLKDLESGQKTPAEVRKILELLDSRID